MKNSHLPRATIPKFPADSLVVHTKTDGVYRITLTPDQVRIEGSGLPAYIYQSALTKDYTFWVRPQIEMEDGRFVHISQHRAMQELARSAYSEYPDEGALK